MPVQSGPAFVKLWMFIEEHNPPYVGEGTRTEDVLAYVLYHMTHNTDEHDIIAPLWNDCLDIFREMD